MPPAMKAAMRGADARRIEQHQHERRSRDQAIEMDIGGQRRHQAGEEEYGTRVSTLPQ